jgi:FAD/FMN-containing dehydrogenase
MTAKRVGLSRRSALKGLAVAAGAIPLLGSPLSAVAAPLTSGGGPADGGADGAATLTGRLVYPQDPDYDAARAGWDALFSTYPQVVVFCQNTDDVVNALRYARENDIAFRARSGRHALEEGWNSIDGGIVIDVSALKSISVDLETKTATVGTGLNQGELVNALAKTPLAFPTGDEASVGLGGVTLGGGIGVLSPKMGVACDNLLAVEIVVPEGRSGAQVLRADLEQNSDLLWACRGGGGGNFGIATSYEVQLHDIPHTVGIWEVTWPFGAVEPAFDAWQRWAPSADERLGSTFEVFTPSAGLKVSGVFLGPPDQARELVAPLLEVPGAQFTVNTQTWVEHYNASNAAPEPFNRWKFTPMWAPEPLPLEAINVVRDMLTRAPSDGCSFWCLSWGGAVRTPPPGGTAFFWRDPIFYAEPGAGWNGAQGNGPHIAWIEQFRNVMEPYVEGGYVNVPDVAIADWGRAYYGSHFERLRAIKSRYDPYGVFSFEQSIPQSQSELEHS